MKHLVDKDKIVAEIEKLISNGKLKCQQSQENNDQVSYIAWSEHIATCGKILLFLDTLEVKEVDLEKEINEWQGCEMFPEGVDITPLPKAMEIVEKTAKHFFELGLKA